MITKAIIQKENNKLDSEQQAVSDELLSNNIPVEYTSHKYIIRKSTPVSKNTLFVGSIGFVQSALNQLNIIYKDEDTYPEILRKYLKREIKVTVLGNVIESIMNFGSPIFVKPKTKIKRFTGAVLESPSDFYKLENSSKRTEVYTSNVIEITDERRYYIVNGINKGCFTWDKESTLETDYKFDKNFINEAIETYVKFGTYKNFAMDFGINENTGETLLIEFNGGYSLGNYGLNSKDYTDLLIGHWLELIGIIK